MKELTELLRVLVAFESTDDNQQEIQKSLRYVGSLFDEGVFKKELLEKNGKSSLLVSFRGKDALSPDVLLSGHLDVVPARDTEEYKVRLEGEIAYGRGTADMKGMAAVLILSMLELAEMKSPPNVALLLNGDEEIGGENGAGYAVRELGLRPQLVVCADGTQEERKIIVKEKGGVWLELRTSGRSAHAAYPWKGENAAEKLMEDIGKIRTRLGAVEPDMWKSTCSVSLFETTSAALNQVPSEARAVLDIRFTEELARTSVELVENLRKLGLHSKLSAVTDVSLVVMDDKHPALKRYQMAAEKILGMPLPLGFSHGASDARYFAETEIPAFVIGARGGNSHASQEWVDVASLQENRRILMEFLKGA